MSSSSNLQQHQSQSSSSPVDATSTNNNNNNNNNQQQQHKRPLPIMLQMTPQAAEANRSTILGSLAFEQPKQSSITIDAIRILMGNTTAGKALLSEEIKKSGFHEKKTWPRPPSTSDGAEMLRLHNKQREMATMNTTTNYAKTSRPATSSSSNNNNNAAVSAPHRISASLLRRENDRINHWSGVQTINDNKNNDKANNNLVRPSTTPSSSNNINKNNNLNSSPRKLRIPNPPLEAPDVPLEKVKKQKILEQQQQQQSNQISPQKDTSSFSENSDTSLLAHHLQPKKLRSTPKLFQDCVANSSALIYSSASETTGDDHQNQNQKQKTSSSLPPSRVPREYWITREHAVIKQVPCEETGGVKTDFEMITSPIFPSDKPISRMELFALARSLDDLLEDRVGAKGFALLQDSEAALSNFSEESGVEKKNPGAVRKTKEYIGTVRAVSDIVDIGLCEVVRHAAASCVERGALLDQLRGMIIALFGNLCDRSENDLERMDLLRDEIKAAEKERDAARQEASNWRKLFFKVNSIGGTSSTKGVTGLLGDVIAQPRNLLLQHKQEEKQQQQQQQQQQSQQKSLPSRHEVTMPTEEECANKSFDEIFREVTSRMETAATEERRIFEERKRERMIAIEKRRKALELEGLLFTPSSSEMMNEDEPCATSSSSSRDRFQEEFDDEMRRNVNILSCPSQVLLESVEPSSSEFQKINSSGNDERQNQNARRGSLQTKINKNQNNSLRSASSSKQQQQSKHLFAHDSSHRKSIRKNGSVDEFNGGGFDDDDKDEDEDDENDHDEKHKKNNNNNKRKLDEVELEREAVFQWINEQFDKRSHAAYDLYLASERHKEVIEKYQQQSMTSALGDLPAEDDSDALQAELAQQPKSIYHVLVGLLTDVHGAVQATDNLSGRMKIDGLHLKHPERSVKVAVRRWRRLAQQIGRFRTENGKRAPIENLKVEFAQLPNPSVVDILFTLVEISSTLSEMSLRLKAAAEAKILDRVLIEPPVPPERPEDPCPLCHRTAPPPDSWGIKNQGNNNMIYSSGNKDKTGGGGSSTSNLLNNATREAALPMSGTNLNSLLSRNGDDESNSAEALRQARMANFLATGGGLGGLPNNINNASSASSPQHVVGDIINSLGLGKYDSHQQQNTSPIVIELKINCSCCAGGTKKPTSGSRRQQRNQQQQQSELSSYDSSATSGSSSYSSSSSSSSLVSLRPKSTSSSIRYASSSGSSGDYNRKHNDRKGRRRSDSSLESDWQIIAGDRDDTGLGQSTKSASRNTQMPRIDSSKNKSNNNINKHSSSMKDRHDGHRRHHHHRSKRHHRSGDRRRHDRDSSSKSKTGTRNDEKNDKRKDNASPSTTNVNNNNNQQNDTAEIREMKALAREMEREEQKAAETLKNKLRGATSMPDFIRRGSMHLGRGDDDHDDAHDDYDDDRHHSRNSRSRRNRHRNPPSSSSTRVPSAAASVVAGASSQSQNKNNRKPQQQQSQQPLLTLTSPTSKRNNTTDQQQLINNNNNSSSNNMIGSRKQSIMSSLGSRKESDMINNNNNNKSSSSPTDRRRKSTRSILSDSSRGGGVVAHSSSSFHLGASVNTARPATTSESNKRKMSTYSEYSVLAPPSIAGTTRPEDDDFDDGGDLSRRPSGVNNNFSRKTTGMMPTTSNGNNNSNNTSGTNLKRGGWASRRSTIKSARSFFSDGSGEGLSSIGNRTAAPSTAGDIPPHRTKSMISAATSRISNSIGKKDPSSSASSAGANGGFIGNARQKYTMFAETRCAKLLFLAGMELNTREEKLMEVEKNVKTGKSATVQESIDAKITTWPLELLLQNIHECYEFFLQNGAGKAKDLGEFIAGSAAQKEKLSVALKPATMMESCEAYAESDERVMNFAQHVIGFTNSVTLRLILTARDKLRLHHTQKLIDVDPELPAKVQITKALRVSHETFDFGDNVFKSLKEDLLRNCVPKLSSTDVQIVLDAPDSVVSAALETALGNRFVPLHLVHTIWRELLGEESAMFKEEFLTEEI